MSFLNLKDTLDLTDITGCFFCKSLFPKGGADVIWDWSDCQNEF